MTLKEGDDAPPFCLPSHHGKSVSLTDFAGKRVVLYFYPKDDTPGCTKQAVSFNKMLADFHRTNCFVIGVSPDAIPKHEKFVTKHDLSLTLLSDEEKETLNAYGVWVEKKMYGKTYMGVERSTFLIDENGVIIKIWRKIRVPGHAEAVYAAVKNS